jgi:uncharacterized membrane protein
VFETNAMDGFGVAFIAGLVLLVLFGPWILLWRVNSWRAREREEDRGQWRDLTSRIYVLEQALKKLQASRSVASTEESLASEEPAGKATSKVLQHTADISSRPSDAAPPDKVDTRQETSPAAQIAYNWVTQKSTSRETTASKPANTPPPDANAGRIFAAKEVDLSLTGRIARSNLEETLGTNWLNKLGIVILVLGVAFFLAYQLKTLGPAGKVLVGFVTAAVMLVAGIWFDRRERYRILARAGIGGGWALAFFTTYAMYHVPAAQILSSQLLDLILLLGVAAAMVAHTLRYRSQVVTGLAFLLAFLTVTISHSNVYSLSAGVVLASALVVIVLRMQWFELEVFGILASYLNHYLWLRPTIEPMHGKHHPFPQFAASAGILGLYWLIFRLSYILRTPNSEKGHQEQERVSTAAAVLNTCVLLGLFKYQSTHPEWAFWALLAIGALEIILGQLPITRRRRTAVIVLSTLGATLLIAAFPFRFSGTRLSVLWLVEAEALLLIGVWTEEIVFRRFGMVGSVLVAGQMIAIDAARIFGRRMDDADLRPDLRMAIVFVVAAAVFYSNRLWLLGRYSDLFAHEFDRRVMQRLSYVAALMVLIAAWIAFPGCWTAVAWCAIGLGMATAADRIGHRGFGSQEQRSAFVGLAELRYQANLLALISVVRVLAINLSATDKFHGLSLRFVTIALVTTLLYVTSKWSADTDRARGISLGGRLFSPAQIAGPAYTWAASFLLALLAWYELRSISVADAWMATGLVLFEIGLDRKKLSLRLQGYAAFAASFARIFVVNLSADGNPGEISPRFYTVAPLALGFFYAYWRLYKSEAELNRSEQKCRVAELCCWFGTITFAALMRFELDADWVAAAWAALAFGLLAIAWRSNRRVFLCQALLIAVGAVSRTALHNFYERSYFPSSGWESRWITVGAAIALLFAALPITFELRKKDEPTEETGIVGLLQSVVRRPEQLFFFSAVGLLTVLLALEMRHGMVTLSWGVEGVAVFVLALWLGERSFRLTGLGLLLLCVGKILVVDVWRLDARDRYLTFIVLGAALLLVSFLYTRNREALRQYL